MKKLISTPLKLLRTAGPRWLLFRLWYAAQQKSGILRLRMPARPQARSFEGLFRPGVPTELEAYAAWRKIHGGKFFFSDVRSLAPSLSGWSSGAVAEAEAILAGTLRYFGHLNLPVGFPPDWHLNPLTRERIAADRHWSRIDVFEQGDIKLIWEASRFRAAYTLVRAYGAGGDERFAKAFWASVDDWIARNPFQLGPNWCDGQEAALRAMAWCFGAYGLLDWPSAREHWKSLLPALSAHAERIEGNLAYSRAQKNNHAVSEGACLWTVGLLFPELRHASRWREKGRRILEAEARRQIYSDGSYVMHSFNYLRSVLHTYLWCSRLGEINDCRLSQDVYRRVEKATQFLLQLIEPATGQAPNHGSNDGSLVLPFNTCDDSDFRPVLQACHYLLHQEHLFPPGAWDEDLVWLFGPKSLERPAQARDRAVPSAATQSSGERACTEPPKHAPFSATEGGYFALYGARTWGMIRCASFRDRPGHADQLHLDLWWQGVNIACDAGTYLYNGPPPWRNGLADTHVHNTVTVDGLSQADRLGRFLWLDWPQGRVLRLTSSAQKRLDLWEGEHHGYKKVGAVHRRAVMRVSDLAWLVVDDVAGSAEHFASLHWLLRDFPYELAEGAGLLRLRTPAGPMGLQVWCSREATLRLVRAGKRLHGAPSPLDPNLANEGTRGWRSLRYALKEPALSVELEAHGSLPIRFVSLLELSPSVIRKRELNEFVLETEKGVMELILFPPGAPAIVRTCKFAGGEFVDEINSTRQPA